MKIPTRSMPTILHGKTIPSSIRRLFLNVKSKQEYNELETFFSYNYKLTDIFSICLELIKPYIDNEIDNLIDDKDEVIDDDESLGASKPVTENHIDFPDESEVDSSNIKRNRVRLIIQRAFHPVSHFSLEMNREYADVITTMIVGGLNVEAHPEHVFSYIVGVLITDMDFKKKEAIEYAIGFCEKIQSLHGWKVAWAKSR